MPVSYTTEFINRWDEVKIPELSRQLIIATFLLIQHGEVLSVCERAHSLNFELLEEWLPWVVYAGIKDSTGKKTFRGPVVQFHGMNPSFQKYMFYNHSILLKSVFATELPTESIKTTLFQLTRNGAFSNADKLPQIDVFTG